MIVKTLVRRGDQFAVKPLLTSAGLIAGDEDDRLPERVESESCTPCAVRSIKALLLHIGVFRVFQRVQMRPPLPRKATGYTYLSAFQPSSYVDGPREMCDCRSLSMDETKLKAMINAQRITELTRHDED